MNREPFVNDQYYHIYNRGTDSRVIFNEAADYYRFIMSLRLFNTKDWIRIRDLAPEKKDHTPNDPLIEIVCYALMPNHIHLVLKQIEDNGIAKFLQKLVTGYTEYFNTKNERTGVLFQGRTKSILIDNDAYLLHLSRYIHLNPLDIFFPAWKTEGINWKEAESVLKGYPWTSLKKYLNKYDKDNVILGQFHDTKDYQKFLASWTERDLEDIHNFILED